MAEYRASGYKTGRGNWQYDPVKQKYFTPAYETEEDFKRNQLAAQRAQEDAALKQELEKQAEETRKRFAGYIPPDITSVEKTGPVELQDILARQKGALEGYNAEQLAAMRAQMAQGQQAAQLQRDRALQAALAKQNIRGGAAASLQTQAALQAARERAGQDTEMMLRQAAKQEEGLKQYREGVMGSLDLAQKRQFQELATKLAAEQAAAAQEAGRRGQTATERYGESMAQSQKGTVICTELHRQGLMSDQVYEADQRFGRELYLRDPELMAGYHAWAKPIVKVMKQNKLFTHLVFIIATPWAKQMAYEMGIEAKPNYIGKLMLKVGLPFCKLVGKFVKKEVVHA